MIDALKSFLQRAVLLLCIAGLSGCSWLHAPACKQARWAPNLHGRAPKLSVASSQSAFLNGRLGPLQGEDRRRLVKAIKAEGGQVLVVGDTLLVDLPADQLFPQGTTRLHAKEVAGLLTPVVALLRAQPKVDVQVSAYTDNWGAPLRMQRVTQVWAEQTARYLWQHRVDARLLTSRGLGAAQPIASNLTASGRANNRRVEIKATVLTTDLG